MSSALETYSPRSPALTPRVSLDEIPPKQAFRSQLSGPDAFYKRPTYEATTIREFSRDSLLPVTYQLNTQHKIVGLAKQLFSVIFFPKGIYNLIHSCIGFAILPSTCIYSRREITALRKRQIEHIMGDTRKASLSSKFKYKRITIEVDGYKIDAAILGTPSTLGNGRWTLKSFGNGEIYEHSLSDPNFLQMLSETESNAILFEYPAVGSSSGRLPSREAMEKAYTAVLSFLEDKEEGIGATEIIGFGFSIGGGVQGDALRHHELKKEIKYLFVKARTFSDLATEVTHVIGRPIGFLIRFFGWNISSVDSSLKLEAPEIIFQTADVRDYTELHDSSTVRTDGVIPKGAALATALLDDPSCPRANKLFIGAREGHNDPIFDTTYVAKRINRMLPHAKKTGLLQRIVTSFSRWVI